MLFQTELKSVIDSIVIENAKADKKKAKRIGQYKFSENAIYKEDGTYLPIKAITGYTQDRTSVHVSGCCAGGVWVERLIFDTEDKRFPYIFDTLKDVEKALAFITAPEIKKAEE